MPLLRRVDTEEKRSSSVTVNSLAQRRRPHAPGDAHDLANPLRYTEFYMQQGFAASPNVGCTHSRMLMAQQGPPGHDSMPQLKQQHQQHFAIPTGFGSPTQQEMAREMQGLGGGSASASALLLSSPPQQGTGTGAVGGGQGKASNSKGGNSKGGKGGSSSKKLVTRQDIARVARDTRLGQLPRGARTFAGKKAEAAARTAGRQLVEEGSGYVGRGLGLRKRVEAQLRPKGSAKQVLQTILKERAEQKAREREAELAALREEF